MKKAIRFHAKGSFETRIASIASITELKEPWRKAGFCCLTTVYVEDVRYGYRDVNSITFGEDFKCLIHLLDIHVSFFVDALEETNIEDELEVLHHIHGYVTMSCRSLMY